MVGDPVEMGSQHGESNPFYRGEHEFGAQSRQKHDCAFYWYMEFSFFEIKRNITPRIFVAPHKEPIFAAPSEYHRRRLMVYCMVLPKDTGV